MSDVISKKHSEPMIIPSNPKIKSFLELSLELDEPEFSTQSVNFRDDLFRETCKDLEVYKAMAGSPEGLKDLCIPDWCFEDLGCDKAGDIIDLKKSNLRLRPSEVQISLERNLKHSSTINRLVGKPKHIFMEKLPSIDERRRIIFHHSFFNGCDSERSSGQ